MELAIIVALISGLCVAIPSVIATLSSNSKSNALMTYRIEELSKKVETHNNNNAIIIERLGKQDTQICILDKRISILESDKNKENRGE